MTDMTEPTTPEIPGYRIDRPIGAPPYRTFLGTDLRHGRPVVVRLLSPRAKPPATIDHPHVVPTVDHGTVEVGGTSRPFVVSAFIGGSDLGRLEGKLGLAELSVVAADAAAAVEAAHRRGMAHGGLGPRSIVVEETGRAMVTGFGVPSRDARWLSPEEGSGAPPSPAADQYSLARSLAACLREPVPAVVAVFERAGSHDPHGRYPSLAAFVAALQEASGLMPRGVRRPVSEAGSTVPAPGARRLGWGVALAAIALVGAVFWLRRPARSGSAQVVAVFDFSDESDGSTPAAGSFFSDWIGRGLVDAAVAPVVSREATFAARARAVAGPGGGRAEGPERVARSLGATLMITGGYRRLGDSLEVSARVSEALSGRLIRTVGPLRGSATDPGPVARELRSRVTGAVAAYLGRTGADTVAALLRVPPRFEAYREYQRAVALNNESRGRQDEAATAAAAAHALDTAFLAPVLIETTVYLGQSQLPKADSLLRYLDRRRASMSAVERLSLDELAAFRAGRDDQAIDALQALDRIAPRDDNKFSIAQHEFSRNRLEAALAAFERCNAVDGTLVDSETFWAVGAAIKHRLGRYREARATASAGRRRLPQNMLVLGFEVDQAVALGDLAGVDSLLRLSRQFPEVEKGGVIALQLATAAELRIHGHPDRAASLARETLTEMERTVPKEFQNLRLSLLIELAEWERVARLADSIARKPGQGAAAATAAVAWYRLGRPADAAPFERAALADSTSRPGLREFGLARIEAVKGRPEKAMAWLAEALSRGFIAADFQFHVERDFETLRGRPDFAALLQPGR